MPTTANLKTENNPRSYFFVGPVGSGKSTFAASFPQPMYLIDPDQGVESYRDVKQLTYEQYTIDASGWEKILKDVTYIEEHIEEFKTVVVDSTTTLCEIAMKEAFRLNPLGGKKGKPEVPEWNVHYGVVKALVAGVMQRLRSLNVNLVVIGHYRYVSTKKRGEKEESSVLQLSMPGQLRDLFPSYFDEIYYCQTKEVRNTTAHTTKTEHVALTTPQGEFAARSRLSGKAHLLPDVIPNDYPTLIKLIEEGKEKLKSKVK